MENPTFSVKKLAENVTIVAVLGGTGKLLANILIRSTGVINGHVDATCGANPECVQMIVEVVKLLPWVLPALGLTGKKAHDIVVGKCSKNPDGGVNKSINGQYH